MPACEAHSVMRTRGRTALRGFSFVTPIIKTMFIELTRLFENRGFGRDDAHEFIPGFGDGLRPFVLKPGRERIGVDASLGKPGQYVLTIATVTWH